MKKIILLLSFVGFFTCGFSQVDEPIDSNLVSAEFPQFPRGDKARIKFIRKNLNYPQSAIEKGIEGTVRVSFIVEADGSLSDIKIIRGLYPECDAEALRLVSLFPKWIPGKQNGKAVRMMFNMPIKFSLPKK